MAESFEFEVRPIEGATAVIGEEVTFRNEGGKVYALNEDGEAFGVVPAKFASQLEGLGGVAATVASRSGGVPTIAVEVPVGPAPEDVAATAPVEASAEAEEDQAEAPDEFAQESEDAASAPEVETESKVKAAQGETDADKIESAESDAPAAQADASANASGKKKSKTKYIAIAAVAAVVIVIIACVVLFSGEKTQTVTSDWLSIEVPEDWTVEEGDEYSSDVSTYGIYSEDSEFYVVLGTGYSLSGMESVDNFLWSSEIFWGLDSNTLEQSEYENGAVICRYDYSDEDNGMRGYMEFVFSGDEASLIIVLSSEDELAENSETLETILDSLTIENPSEPDFS